MPTIGTEDLKAYCEIAKAYGVKKLAINGLELEFDINYQQVITTTTPPLNLTSDSQPPDDEMLLWSTDHMPIKENTNGN